MTHTDTTKAIRQLNSQKPNKVLLIFDNDFQGITEKVQIDEIFLIKPTFTTSTSRINGHSLPNL